LDGLACAEPPQLVGDDRRLLIATTRVFFQTLERNGLQVLGDVLLLSFRGLGGSS
jgi:hypothetical protein